MSFYAGRGRGSFKQVFEQLFERSYHLYGRRFGVARMAIRCAAWLLRSSRCRCWPPVLDLCGVRRAALATQSGRATPVRANLATAPAE
jgi:hypothetical protein